MRVTFVRGRRVVRVSSSSSTSDSRVRGGILSPLVVSDDDGVVDDGPLMSLVIGGLVLVMVCVVVVELDVLVAVAENDGST